MTKISYLHGIRQRPHLQVKRLAKASNMRKEPRQRYLNFGALTEGELYLALLREQIEIQKGYYHSIDNDYQIALNEVEGALKKNLHKGVNIGTPTGNVPESVSEVIRAVRRAKGMTRPAAGVWNTDQLSLNGNARISGGFDPTDFDSNLLSSLECIFYPEPQYPGHDPASEYNKCMELKRFIDLMNTDFERSAPHHLYRYFTGNPNSETNIFSQKYSAHNQFMRNIKNLTGLSQSTVDLWGSNGIQREQFRKGGEPLYPEIANETHRYAALSGNHDDRIGDPVTAIVAITGLIGAIVGAIQATKQLFDRDNLQPNEKQRLKQGINLFDPGSEFYSAQFEDYDFGGLSTGPGPGPTDTGSSNTLMIGLAAGAAGLLLLNE